MLESVRTVCEWFYLSLAVFYLPFPTDILFVQSGSLELDPDGIKGNEQWLISILPSEAPSSFKGDGEKFASRHILNKSTVHYLLNTWMAKNIVSF